MAGSLDAAGAGAGDDDGDGDGIDDGGFVGKRRAKKMKLNPSSSSADDSHPPRGGMSRGRGGMSRGRGGMSRGRGRHGQGQVSPCTFYICLSLSICSSFCSV
jgi:hypothetical protein